MSFFTFIANLIRDPRGAIASMIAAGPIAAYGFVFLIIFVETGVVFFPFLPGDSLLFASGFFAHGGGFNVVALLLVAWVAAIAGDQCNFAIGHFLGRKIIDSGKVKAMTPERIAKSEAFLQKWGNLAIFLGRFFPFIRTFVPFLAGMGGMHWRNFALYNVFGGITWSTLFILMGYFFGGIPFVQEHFELLIVAIVVLSAIPTVVGLVRSRLNKRKGAAEAQPEAVAVADAQPEAEPPAADQLEADAQADASDAAQPEAEAAQPASQA